MAGEEASAVGQPSPSSRRPAAPATTPPAEAPESPVGEEGGLTDGAQGVLELQGEGGEGHVLRHGHDGHRGQVAGRVPRVPLAAGGVQPKLVTWKRGVVGRPEGWAPLTLSRCHQLFLEDMLVPAAWDEPGTGTPPPCPPHCLPTGTPGHCTHISHQGSAHRRGAETNARTLGSPSSRPSQ